MSCLFCLKRNLSRLYRVPLNTFLDVVLACGITLRVFNVHLSEMVLDI